VPKEKVTLTLDAAQLEELRRIAGARSLSVAVDSAVAAYLSRMRHLAAVDDWLAELERDHGPIPNETLEWAAQLVEQWDAQRSRPAKGRRRRLPIGTVAAVLAEVVRGHPRDAGVFAGLRRERVEVYPVDTQVGVRATVRATRDKVWWIATGADGRKPL
jgi:hypothetical protein